jgi:glycosyltransferase involved in cell wall biosynthesis
MSRIAIGIPVHAEPDRLFATLSGLRTNTGHAADLLLLPDGPDPDTAEALRRLAHLLQSGTSEPLGGPACFNRLAAETDAEVLVLLESGASVGPGWLEHLLAALESDPRNGLAGPSTNRAWNQQQVFPRGGGSPVEVARTAAEAARRFGRTCRTLEPLYSLGDFCYVVRRAVVEAIGAADEAYELGPCWEMDYNVRAARAGFRGVWARAAYVHRAPFTERRRREEAARFEASKRRYQDKFCGARLRGETADYRDHCRGDACSNFAPPGLIARESLIPLGPRTIDGRERTPAASVDVRWAEGPKGPIGFGPSAPLVSGIMPTCDRRPFIVRAVRLFLAQDYPNLELIVVDDGLDPIADCLPDDPRVRHVRLDRKLTVGAKRNRACAEARGEVIVHWDDDDWYPPHRIRVQVRALLDRGADVCGSSQVDYIDAEAGRAWRYAYSGSGRAWVAGSTLAYRRAFWSAHRFPEIQVGEDARFVWSAPAGKVCDLADPSLCVATLHRGNTAPKDVGGVYWRAIDPAPIFTRIGERIDRPAASSPPPLVSCIMPTHDRRAFVPLALWGFARQDYPNRELLIIDDGTDPVGDLADGQPGVRYIRITRRLSIGDKRNLACREARGEVVAHWDDDDWYAPDRLRHQAGPILGDEADLTGLENTYTLYLPSGEFWKAPPQVHRQMFYAGVHGGSIVFRRSILDRIVRYPSVNLAEDAALIHQALHAGRRLMRQENPGVYAYVRHGRNTWRFEGGETPAAAGWERIPPPRTFAEDDLAAYRAAASATARQTITP